MLRNLVPLRVGMGHWLSLGNSKRKLGIRSAGSNAAPENISHRLQGTSSSRSPSGPCLLWLPVSDLVSVCGSIWFS